MDSSALLSPALERLWIEEVRRLHSLWHIGPTTHGSSTPDTLAATNTTGFKTTENRKGKGKKKRRKKKLQSDQAACSSNPCIRRSGTCSTTLTEWPCPPVADHAPDGVRMWGEEERNREKGAIIAAPSEPRMEEEKEKIVALQVQKEGIGACTAFFSEECSSDDEKDLMEEHDDDESDDSPYFKFLVELFVKNGDMRGYYEKNWEKGEFCCLVCSGIGEKVGKRFKDCVSLVQHSNSISKTKKKRAHREFAKVVCSVLGWNMERLPSIVLDVGNRLGQSLVKSTTAAVEDVQKCSVLNQEEELLAEAPDISEMVHKDTMEVMEAEDVQKCSVLNQEEELLAEAPYTLEMVHKDTMDVKEAEDVPKCSVLNQEEELLAEAPDILEMVHKDAMDVMAAEDVPQMDDAENLPKQVMGHT